MKAALPKESIATEVEHPRCQYPLLQDPAALVQLAAFNVSQKVGMLLYQVRQMITIVVRNNRGKVYIRTANNAWMSISRQTLRAVECR